MALPVAPSVPPPPDPAWTEAERWAWNKIVEGSIADFQDRPGCAGCPDPSAGSTGWTDPCRQISPRFLEAALTQSPWRDAIPRQGFRVAGARVEGRIDLSNAHIDAEVQLERMRFEQCLVITSAHFASSLSIIGSTFEDGISCDFLRVEGSRFRCCNATARGERFDLLRATIDGNLNLSGSKFECNEVRLVRLSLAGDLLAKNCNLAVCLDLFGASIEGSVNLEGSTLPALRLAAASISDELVLTRCPERPVKWTTSAVAAPAAQPVLDLRSARIGALADLPLPKMPKPTQKNADSRVTQAGWPSSLDVQGLHYDRLGGAADPDGVSMAARDSAWYVAWLSRNASSGSQPYQKLAANLRASGHVRQANDVLFAARDRELSEAWRSKSLRRWLFLFLARLLIGYGIGAGYWKTTVPVIAFTFFGAGVLQFSTDPYPRDIIWRLAASLDHLLPIIEINPEFGAYFNDPERKRLTDCQHMYFWFHTFVGYILGIFLAAGFAGFTQKS